MKNLFKTSALLIIATTVLSACGSNNDAKQADDQTTTTTTTTAETPTTTVSEPVEIEANDQMQFNKNEIKAIAGQEITVTLKNVGKMDKTVMGHNFVVLKPGTDVADYAKKAMAAKDTDYIPASESGNVVAHTKLTGAGETDTIKFTIAEKGTYEFICSFPGHYGLMRGKLIVE